MRRARRSKAHLAGAPMPPPPSDETDRARMMDFVAGAEIPEHYAPFLMEELAMSGEDPKRPDWSSPKLKAAAPKLPVVVIGAGMSGLLAGIRLKQAGIPFTIVEKNAEVGGTWFENQLSGLPGRQPQPPLFLLVRAQPRVAEPLLAAAGAARLLQGRRRQARPARAHPLRDARSRRPRWTRPALVWRVRVKDKAGQTETLTAKAVISAVGQLNQPQLPGHARRRDDFKGPAFHSARWRHDVDLTGKRVAVIGTGASAFQFVPEVAKDAAHLTVFQRTPPWLAPTPDYHEPTTAAESWLIEHMPFYGKWYRFWLFWMLTDGIYEAVKSDPTWNGGPGAVSPANAHDARDALGRHLGAGQPTRRSCWRT